MNHKAFTFALAAVSGALLALTAAPAQLHAQNLMPGFQLGAQPELTPEEKARNEANEKAAKDAMKSVKAPKVSNDPWGDMRSSDATAAKPAKSKKVQ
ncbi:MAG: hypothetical protein EKK40_12265 [Bradyrhizobiaceae bacterium]|nr:MAG: hypothetical protein EKK40_12265 [Bradyrhizobiaceae bacterium]